MRERSTLDKADEKSFASGFKPHTDGNIGQTTQSCPSPIFTPEIVAQLIRESRELGDAFHLRILKMWDISWQERKATCCPLGCCPRVSRKPDA